MDFVVLGLADVGHYRERQASDDVIIETQSIYVFSLMYSTPDTTDCRVPDGATVLEFKTCENCGRPFTRPKAQLRPVVVHNPDDYFSNRLDEAPTKTIYRDTGIKFCSECYHRYLMPVEEQVYRETLPKIAHHPQRLIHFDDSLLPQPQQKEKRKVVARVRIPLTSRKQLGDWKLRLRNAIAERGPLSMNDMIGITGHKNYNTLKVNLIRAGAQTVGSVWPRNKMGQPARLYII